MKDDNGSGLPVGVAAAWGLRERPSKGPRPGLSLDRIVAAGVAIAQAEGLSSVSMSKVAAEVGVTAMALYRYVGNKEELLTLMVDSALGPPPEVPRPGQGWRAGLTEWARAENEAYRRHPWALRVPIRGLPALPNQFAWMDRGLRCLRAEDVAPAAGGGLDADTQLSTILLISNVVRSYSLIDNDITEAIQTSGQTPEKVMADLDATFTRLVDPERFPALSAVLATGALSKADPMDKELSFALGRVLDGIALLLSGPGAP
jgi:AcrR family transcriptional regulator